MTTRIFTLKGNKITNFWETLNKNYRCVTFSVGDPNVKLDIELEWFKLLETDKVDVYWLMSGTMLSGPSSPGRHVSTIASRQFTTSSALSGASVVWFAYVDNFCKLINWILINVNNISFLYLPQEMDQQISKGLQNQSLWNKKCNRYIITFFPNSVTSQCILVLVVTLLKQTFRIQSFYSTAAGFLPGGIWKQASETLMMTS